jgi:hypothetical protein
MDSRNGVPDPKDKENFSKCLSAFANSDGGVLVWGVKTDHRDQVDRAADCRPFAEPEKFRARLQDYLLAATQPPVDGVSLAVVSAHRGAGFVKCLIPASDKPPHMASDNKYYRRTSNGSRQMEHIELEDMFGRRQRPVLKLRIALAQTMYRDVPCELLELGLLNEGRAVAKYSNVFCELKDTTISKIEVADGPLQYMAHVNAGRPVLSFTGDGNNVIHTNGINAHLGAARIYRGNIGQELQLSAVIAAEDMPTKRLEGTIRPNSEKYLQ